MRGIPARPIRERFDEKVDRSKGPSACWNWIGSLCSHGYGQFTIKNRGARVNAKAHRLAYELSNGPIPAGKWVLHSCDNRACCNPAHLSVGDRAENMRQASVRLRCVHGAAHSQSKLTDSAVREIRAARANGEPAGTIADRFGITPCNVRRVVRRAIWRHVA